MLGAHPESGVEVDVICAAYVLVLFFCTVQSSDTDGSTPVYKARNGTLSTTSFHPVAAVKPPVYLLPLSVCEPVLSWENRVTF